MFTKFKYHLFFVGVFLFTTLCAWGASHHPQVFLKSITGTPNEGQQIVQHYCANCHAKKPRIPLGAPRIGVVNDWNARTKNGLSVLFKNTNEGLNAMPARGGCFECSDEQLIQAILALLPKQLKDRVYSTHKAHKKNT